MKREQDPNSNKWYKKLNFEVEGNFKESIFKDGKYYDVIILAKLNNL